MKKKQKNKICECCGHYWNPSKTDHKTCGICGVGNAIKIGSKMDYRRAKKIAL